MNKVSRPKSDREALIMALVVAINAPSDQHMEMAAQLAEKFASNLTPQEVEACKAIAAVMAEA